MEQFHDYLSEVNFELNLNSAFAQETNGIFNSFGKIALKMSRQLV